MWALLILNWLRGIILKWGENPAKNVFMGENQHQVSTWCALILMFLAFILWSVRWVDKQQELHDKAVCVLHSHLGGNSRWDREPRDCHTRCAGFHRLFWDWFSWFWMRWKLINRCQQTWLPMKIWVGKEDGSLALPPNKRSRNGQGAGITGDEKWDRNLELVGVGSPLSNKPCGMWMQQ